MRAPVLLLTLATCQAQVRDFQCAEVSAHASAPAVGGHATLRATKQSLRGAIAYARIRMNGDQRVLRAVVAPYITSDMAGRVGVDALSITRAEYVFKRVKTEERNGRPAGIFDVQPRKNAAGRFSGKLWLDAVTGSPLKISGHISQPDSGPFRQVEILNEYDASGRLARQALSIDTPSIGRTALQISLSPCQTER